MSRNCVFFFYFNLLHGARSQSVVTGTVSGYPLISCQSTFWLNDHSQRPSISMDYSLTVIWAALRILSFDCITDHRIVTSIRLDIKFFIMLRSSEENGETLLSVQNFNVLPKWRLWRTIRRICVWCSDGSGNLRMVERQCATDDTTLPRGPKCPWG